MKGTASTPSARRMLIKVCGLREAENIRQICRLDIDWIGFIFYPRSPRYVLPMLTPDITGGTETLIRESVPGRRPGSPAPRRVGVFVDESAERMAEIAGTFRLDYLQLHGHETADECYALQKRGYSLIKAFSVGSAADLLPTQAYEGRVDYFLFDTLCTGYGGSGRRFDWDLLSGYTGRTPFLLSGGIGPDSLEALRSFRHPRLAGIDLNSAFESSPGRKKADKLAHFVDAFRALSTTIETKDITTTETTRAEQAADEPSDTPTPPSTGAPSGYPPGPEERQEKNGEAG